MSYRLHFASVTIAILSASACAKNASGTKSATGPTPAATNFGHDKVCPTVDILHNSSDFDPICVDKADALAAQGVTDPLAMTRALCDDAGSMGTNADAPTAMAKCFEGALPKVPSTVAASSALGQKICTAVVAAYASQGTANKIQASCDTGVQAAVSSGLHDVALVLSSCSALKDDLPNVAPATCYDLALTALFGK